MSERRVTYRIGPKLFNNVSNISTSGRIGRHAGKESASGASKPLRRHNVPTTARKG
jgi:hypothetical protein